MYLGDVKIIENEAYYKSILLKLYEKFLKISEEMLHLALEKLFVDYMRCFLVNNYEDII